MIRPEPWTTDVEAIAAAAVRMDRLVDDLTAACEHAEARDGRVLTALLARLADAATHLITIPADAWRLVDDALDVWTDDERDLP